MSGLYSLYFIRSTGVVYLRAFFEGVYHVNHEEMSSSFGSAEEKPSLFGGGGLKWSYAWQAVLHAI